tara:strand:+ start:62 stop:589 length:528 start_codon:yes stop_codon:yes gene_type:complete
MIKVKGKKIIDRKNFFIKWDTKLKISQDAARMTGYSEKNMKKNAVSPEEAFPTIHDWLENCDYICGHNVLGFDIYLLRGLYKYFNKNYQPLVPKVIDTFAVAKGIKLNYKYDKNQDFTEYQYRVINTIKRGLKCSLGALGKEFDIDHDESKLHDALVDLELNVKVWNHLKSLVEL